MSVGTSQPSAQPRTWPGAIQCQTMRSIAHPRTNYTSIKRVLDVVLASTALVVLSPVLIAIWLTVRLTLGSPVIFAQTRPGLYARPFRMYKFRSMTDSRDESGQLLPDAQRITPVGRLLRRSSLDELPELWNVVKGDMSLVGPRPLLTEYLPFYTTDELRRHNVRPGITGLAQTQGRNTLSWDEKFRLDRAYVDSMSIRLDARILLMTILKVLYRDGVLDAAPEGPLHAVRVRRQA